MRGRTWLLLALFIALIAAIPAAGAAQAPPGQVGLPAATAAAPEPEAAPRPEQDHFVYLPVLRTVSLPPCMPLPEEQQIAALLIGHPQQGRPSLTCHPILAQVARARAEDMRDRAYFSHTNPDGFGPNYLVTQAGYVLPDYYPKEADSNNIESIAAGYPTAAEAWQGWLNSPPHRTHVLAELPFFAAQVEYGIGYASGGPYGHYWVLLTAEPGP